MSELQSNPMFQDMLRQVAAFDPPPRSTPEPVTDGEWAVYKLYDADQMLLYVGISKSVAARLAGHEQDKSWWSQVAEINIERYVTEADARRVERHAIVWLRPMFNKQHNYRRRFHPDIAPARRVEGTRR